VLGEALAHGVDRRVGLVPRLHELELLLVVGRVHLGVLHHLLDLGFGEARVRLDGDLVLLAGRLVLGADVQDAVGVDVERDLDLRHAARRRGDAFEVEFAEALVARRQFTLALEDLDRHRRLVVVGGREDLRVLGRDGRVLLNHLRHHAAQGLDAEAERGDVEEQHVLAVAGEDLALDGGADGHGLVGIDVLARLLAEELLHLLLHLRHPRHAADEDHVVDLRGRDPGVLDGRLERLDRARDQVLDERLELGPRQLDVEVLRARRVGRDVRQVDVRLRRVRELDLRLLGRFLQALQGEHVLREVDALVLLELGDDEVDDPLIEVLAAEERVAVGREDLELLLAVDVGDLDDGDVERAATQVVDGDLAVALALLAVLVEAEGESRRGRLVDDPLDVEAGDAAGVLRRLALRVVEVGGDGDHGLGHGLAEVVLGRLLHLAQDLGADLLRRELLAPHLDPRVAVVGRGDLVRHEVDVLLDFLLRELAADQPLDGVHRVPRVGHRLPLGGGADEDLATLLVGDDRRRRPRALAVLDHLGGVAFHDRHARVGRTEVDADDLGHESCSPKNEMN
jgi:hypothetical protein